MEVQNIELDKQHTVSKVRVEQKAKVRIPGTKRPVYLRVYGDFTNGRDIATFAYSLDGKDFIPIGSDMKMIFDGNTFFMGTKFAIFNYATKQKGGYIDIDWFHIDHEG